MAQNTQRRKKNNYRTSRRKQRVVRQCACALCGQHDVRCTARECDRVRTEKIDTEPMSPTQVPLLTHCWSLCPTCRRSRGSSPYPTLLHRPCCWVFALTKMLFAHPRLSESQLQLVIDRLICELVEWMLFGRLVENSVVHSIFRPITLRVLLLLESVP